MARILLIDDDDFVRTMLKVFLARSGHTVIEACDGQEGLDLFPEAEPDLVITDLMMPKKTGLEVMATLRERQPPVKIIAISAGGKPGEVHPLETARQLGAVGVVAKPFTCATLGAAINEALFPDATATAAGG